jgi:hypothetical protein
MTATRATYFKIHTDAEHRKGIGTAGVLFLHKQGIAYLNIHLTPTSPIYIIYYYTTLIKFTQHLLDYVKQK